MYMYIYSPPGTRCCIHPALRGGVNRLFICLDLYLERASAPQLLGHLPHLPPPIRSSRSRYRRFSWRRWSTMPRPAPRPRKRAGLTPTTIDGRDC